MGCISALVQLLAWAPVDIPGMQYPVLARAAYAQGKVVVQCVIANDGTVRKATVISGHPLLAPAAANSARTWRFGRPLGDTHDDVFLVTFDFRLEGRCGDTGCKENFVLHYPDSVTVTSEYPGVQP